MFPPLCFLEGNYHIGNMVDSLFNLSISESCSSQERGPKDDSSWHVSVESHFWEDCINEWTLDCVTLGMGEVFMVEGIGKSWFVSNLIDQRCIVSCHCRVRSSAC